MPKFNNNQIVRISKLTQKDISKVMSMYKNSSENLKQAFRDPPVLTNRKWLIMMYLSLTPVKPLLPGKVTAYVGKQGANIVGFAYITEKRKFKQLGIMVKELFWGRGIADKLMSAILKDQSDIALSVFSSNERAKALYRKHGFKTEYTLEYMGKN